MKLPPALAPLLSKKSWVIWRREKRGERWTKPPFQAKAPSRRASTADHSTWSDYETAAAAAEKLGLGLSNGGLGFVLPESGISGIDLDNCIHEDGSISAWAKNIIARSNEAYLETSPSRRGFHLIGRTSRPDNIGKGPWAMPEEGKLEIYANTRRYLTVTGSQVGGGDELTCIDGLMDELIFEHGKKNEPPPGGETVQTMPPDKSSSGIFDKVVCRLFERGLEPEEVLTMMRKYPHRYVETKAAVYEKRGDLPKQVKACWEKWKERHKPQLSVVWEGGKLPKASCPNAKVAVRALGVVCRYDLFHYAELVEGGGLEEMWAGKVTDNTIERLRAIIYDRFRFDPGKEHVRDAVRQLALEHSFDPVREYVDGLVWDGKARVDGWVVRYLGCPDTELNRAIGRAALIASVRRVRAPGVKFDQIIVLEGEEGTKSLWSS